MRMSDLPAHVRAKIEPAKKAKRPPAKSEEKSALEEKFAFQLRCQGTHFPVPEREYKFHPNRGWRFDFAFPRHHIAVEIEGGVWVQGRHQRPEGFTEDCRKYNHATVLGWHVFRFTEDMIVSLEALAVLEAAFYPSRAHRLIGQ